MMEEMKKIKVRRTYTVGEEIASSVSHGVGVLLSIAYFVLLLIKGIKNDSALAIIAYVSFAVCSIMLYLASTLYHALSSKGIAKKVWHRFDHVNIYLLIAGTYTPFTLLAIKGNLGLILFIVVWVLALTGIVLKAVFFKRLKKLHLINYVVLGWICIFYVKTILDRIGPMASLLLILGGVMYTVGVTFYVMKKYRYTHFVWHLFVMAGTILHFLAIYLYI